MKPIDRNSVFLELSKLLTGFSRVELEGTGMVSYYYGFLDEQFGPGGLLEPFYREAAAVLKLKGAARDARLRRDLLPPSCYGGLAQILIQLWYLGSYNGNPLSPNAYVQSLVWTAAGTHPMGAKQPGHGSWSHPPAGISFPQKQLS